MSSIIKAGQVRFASPEAMPPGKPPPEARAEIRTPQAPAPDREDIERAIREECQAAYDELIAAAQDEVALLIADARAEAQRAVQEAERQVNELRQTAYSAGYAEGLETVRAETEEILRAADADAQAALDSAQAERDAMFDEMEPRLLKLALEVAEKILHYELEQNDSAYMTILTAALGAIKAESKVTLRVNPAEYVRYFNSRDTAKLRTPNGNLTAQVMIDSSVESGGCQIDTDSGSIDCGLHAQIGRIANSLGLE